MKPVFTFLLLAQSSALHLLQQPDFHLNKVRPANIISTNLEATVLTVLGGVVPQALFVANE